MIPRGKSAIYRTLMIKKSKKAKKMAQFAWKTAVEREFGVSLPSARGPNTPSDFHDERPFFSCLFRGKKTKLRWCATVSKRL